MIGGFVNPEVEKGIVSPLASLHWHHNFDALYLQYKDWLPSLPFFSASAFLSFSSRPYSSPKLFVRVIFHHLATSIRSANVETRVSNK